MNVNLGDLYVRRLNLYMLCLLNLYMVSHSNYIKLQKLILMVLCYCVMCVPTGINCPL